MMCTLRSYAAGLFVYFYVIGTCVHSNAPSVNSSFPTGESPLLYKCLRVPLAQVLVIPERLMSYSAGSGQDALLIASKPQRRGNICEHQIAVRVKLDSEDLGARRSKCNFSIDRDGRFRIGGSLMGIFLYLPEHYCFARASRSEMLVFFCSEDSNGTKMNRTKSLDCSNVLHAMAIDTTDEDRVVRLRDYEEYVKIITASVCACIDLTVISAYFLVWEKQSCYGWSVTAMIVSLTVHYTSVVLDGVVCFAFQQDGINLWNFLWLGLAATLVKQFAFLCAYSWALVLAFLVWKMLSELSARSNAPRGVKQFLKLCIFGYGVPAGFVGMGLVIFSVTNPNYPLNSFDYVDSYLAWFFMLPSGVMCLCSAILMGLTIKKLREAKSNCKELRVHGGAERRSEYLNVVMICRLLVLVGLNYGIDMILFYVIPFGLNPIIRHVLHSFYLLGHSCCLVWIFLCNQEMRDNLVEKCPKLASCMRNKS